MDAHKNPEKLNFSYIGIQYYVVTWSCHEHQPRFTQHDRVDLVRKQFLRASQEANVADIADCFMPDHIHHLVQGTTSEADAGLYMRKAKQYSGLYFHKAFHMKLWGGKGFDRRSRCLST
jgi:REP element-mobilizing transposase RayT